MTIILKIFAVIGIIWIGFAFPLIGAILLLIVFMGILGMRP